MQKVLSWEAQERLSFLAQNAELQYLLSGQIRQNVTVKQEVVLMACQQTIFSGICEYSNELT